MKTILFSDIPGYAESCDSRPPEFVDQAVLSSMKLGPLSSNARGRLRAKQLANIDKCIAEAGLSSVEDFDDIHEATDATLRGLARRYFPFLESATLSLGFGRDFALSVCPMFYSHEFTPSADGEVVVWEWKTVDGNEIPPDDIVKLASLLFHAADDDLWVGVGPSFGLAVKLELLRLWWRVLLAPKLWAQGVSLQASANSSHGKKGIAGPSPTTDEQVERANSLHGRGVDRVRAMRKLVTEFEVGKRRARHILAHSDYGPGRAGRPTK